MSHVRPYVTAFVLMALDALQYRVNLALSWVMNLYMLAAPIALWIAIYHGRSTLWGYDRREILAYLLLVNVFARVLFANGVETKVSGEIRDGKLNHMLGKPISYTWYNFATFLGKRLVELASILVPFVVVAYALQKAEVIELRPTITGLLLFIISGAIGAVISFLMHFLLGLIAFWLTECSAVHIAVGQVLFSLAGGLFPLDLWTGVKPFLQALPFGYQIYFPLRVLMGHLSPKQLAAGFLLQSVWLVTIIGLSRWVWDRGVRRYAAIGG